MNNSKTEVFSEQRETERLNLEIDHLRGQIECLRQELKYSRLSKVGAYATYTVIGYGIISTFAVWAVKTL